MAAVRYGFRESRFFKFKVGLSFLDCQSVWDCPCELGWHVQTYQKKERSTPCILNQSLFLQLTKEQYWLWTHTCLCGCLFLPAWALVKIGKKYVWEVMSKIFLYIRVSLDLHFELLKKKRKNNYCLLLSYVYHIQCYENSTFWSDLFLALSCMHNFVPQWKKPKMSREVRELKSKSSTSKIRSALVEMCSVPEKVSSCYMQ